MVRNLRPLVVLAGLAMSQAGATTLPGVKFTVVGPNALVAGQPAVLKAYARNTTAEPILLRIGEGGTPDFVLTDENGTVIWNRYANRANLDYLSVIALKAGQTLMWKYVCSGSGNDGRPLAPGAYTFHAQFSTDQTTELTWVSSKLAVTLR